MATVYQGCKRDALSYAAAQISYEHAEIHGGSMFTAWALDESIGTGVGSDLVIAWKTPASDATTTKLGHFTFIWTCKTAGHADFLEGPTWTAQTGSEIAVYNRYRSSTNTTIMLQNESDAAFTDYDSLIKNPASFTGGTIIWQDYAFAEKKGTVSSRANNEIIAKANTTYAVRIVPDAATSGVFARLTWYEHTNR